MLFKMKSFCATVFQRYTFLPSILCAAIVSSCELKQPDLTGSTSRPVQPLKISSDLAAGLSLPEQSVVVSKNVPQTGQSASFQNHEQAQVHKTGLVDFNPEFSKIEKPKIQKNDMILAQSSKVNLSKQRMLAELNGIKIDCELSPCPNSIGLLITPKDPGCVKGSLDCRPTDTQCTATLVAPGIIITASHCIPKAVLDKKDCSGLGFVLPKADSNGERVASCKKILIDTDQKSHERASSLFADMAILELDRIFSVETEQIARAGAGHGEKEILYILAIDPAKGGGVLKQKTCVTALNSSVVENFTDVHGPVIPLFGASCSTVVGNSGAGVFNFQRKLVAVIQSVETAEMFNTYQKRKEYGRTHPYSAAGNLMCAKLPRQIDIEAPAICAAGEPISIDDKTAARPKLQSEIEYLELIEKASESLSSVYEWNPEFAAEQKNGKTVISEVRFKPMCLRPMSRWLQQEYTIFDSKNTPGTKLVSTEAPIIKIQRYQAYDEYNRVLFQRKTEAIGGSRLLIRSSDATSAVESGQKIIVTRTHRYSESTEKTTVHDTISSCGAGSENQMAAFMKSWRKQIAKNSQTPKSQNRQ
jgi:hypothetical protein